MCFQAYLEFFVQPDLLAALLPLIERDGNVTYYAINKRGDLRTNTHSDGPNAVTWGVFPGKEIIQPTIVEAVSFMAWKVRPQYLSIGCSNNSLLLTGRSIRARQPVGTLLRTRDSLADTNQGSHGHIFPGQRRPQRLQGPAGHLQAVPTCR